MVGIKMATENIKPKGSIEKAIFAHYYIEIGDIERALKRVEIYRGRMKEYNKKEYEEFQRAHPAINCESHHI